MKKILLILTLVIGLSLALFSQATAGNGKMRGVVLNAATGEPIAGVTVKLYLVKQAAYYRPSPTTDKNGKWKAFHIRGGMWNLDFEKVGFEPTKLSYNVDTRPGMKRSVIQVKLKKMEGPALDAGIVEEINKARDLLNSDKVQEAINEFTAIKEKFKESSGISIVNLYIGNAYSQIEEYAKAIESYEEALDKYPKHNGLILSIGNSYSNMAQPEKAMEWFKKIPFEEIDNTDTLYNIGVGFYNTFKYDDALKYFKKAIEINPEYAPAYYQLGMTYTAMSKTTEAVDMLNKFMELDPDSPDYQTAKAIVDAFSK
ncbi:MAG: tetratricopeptide repeat protein [Candidatus Aminicenantes bacterium]|nr:tetratricopeptide repeat protein [Candidatus Aminicenantes bacterium]